MGKTITSAPVTTYGRMFSQYLIFLDMVRSGKKCIIYSKDYVVIDRKTYDEYWNERKKRLGDGQAHT